MRVWEPQSAYRAKKGDEWSALAGRIAALDTPAEVDAFWDDYLIGKARDLPSDWTPLIQELCGDRKADLHAEQLNRRLDAIVGDIARNG